MFDRLGEDDRDVVLVQKLKRYPLLRSRMESLLAVVEDAEGDVEKADAAEKRVIEELRQMGHEALTAWAERGVERSAPSGEAEGRPGGKKNSTGTRASEKSR